MKAVYKRELNSYFHSMLGYVFIAFLTAFTGVYFMAYNLNAGYPYFSYTLSGTMFILIIAVPILTMKCFAEERRSKTDQLLLTSPVSLSAVVTGKYLAMVTVFAVPNVIFCLYPLIIKSQGNAYFAVDYAAILVFFLLGCVYIAIGMFLSSVTESQIIAAVGTFGILLVLFPSGRIDSIFCHLCGSQYGRCDFILTLVAVIIYQVTKNWAISAVVEIAGVVASVVTYVVKDTFLRAFLATSLGN